MEYDDEMWSSAFSCGPVRSETLPRRASAVFEVFGEDPPRVASPPRKAAAHRRPRSLQVSPSAATDASAATATTSIGAPSDTPTTADEAVFSVAIRGGSATSSAPELEYHAALERILRTSSAILANGGTSEDAMEATINLMEDSLSRTRYNRGSSSH